MCTSFYYSTNKCTGWWHCGSTPKDELSDPRGSLANEIEQANQEDRQDNCHSHNTHQTKCQMHNNFGIFKFHVYLILYARLFTKLNLFKTLRYGTFIAMKISRTTVCSYVQLDLKFNVHTLTCIYMYVRMHSKNLILQILIYYI